LLLRTLRPVVPACNHLNGGLLQPRIVVSSSSQGWAALAAEVIGEAIKAAVASRGACYLMLTGGKTAEQLYDHWARASALPLERMRLLFGDERCVPPDHADSNYALVMRTLLAKAVPPGCSVARMEAENSDREAAARAYEKLLPEAIDVLLLGVGTDGHVASLFPHSPAFRAGQRTVVPVTGPKPPRERLTITPKVIAGAREVFVLARGAEKGGILVEALKSPADSVSLPVRLALGGTWLLDEKAACQLLNRGKEAKVAEK